VLVWGGVLVAVLLVLSVLWDVVAARRTQDEGLSEEPARFDPFAGGYPVPPLPGQELPSPRETVSVAATSAPRGPTDETEGEEDGRA
jgi:NADH-quinone oxidoreductase subunit H